MTGGLGFLMLGKYQVPVRKAVLAESRDGEGDYRWSIEVNADELPLPKDDEEADEGPWFLGAEPYLYAQMLPLRVKSWEELAGRRFEFSDSPHDDPPCWECSQWPFFCIHTWEHDYVHPVSLRFLGLDKDRVQVVIDGRYPCGGETARLLVISWLTYEPH
jgi:hypothetical protein